MSRKPGILCRFTCCRCGAVELVSGGTTAFQCAACVEKFGGRTVWTGKDRAGQLVSRAIRNGELRRPSEFSCVDCQAPAEQYDHRDYNYPLRVDSVCKRCNLRRGPAIPKKGYFTKIFERGFGHYTSKRRMAQLFSAIGIAADLSALPGYVDFDDWLPFKEALLQWDQQ